MKRRRFFVWLAGASLLTLHISCSGGGDASVSDEPDPDLNDPTEVFAGGDATVFNASDDAFSFPLPNLVGERVDDFFVGNAFFRTNWVTAPSTTLARDGLGPLFNGRGCEACHLVGPKESVPDEEIVDTLTH
ncbi:MAG: di-heme oxidoredictase family protein, partial [Planctomycetota bacterium]